MNEVQQLFLKLLIHQPLIGVTYETEGQVSLHFPDAVIQVPKNELRVCRILQRIKGE
ncbi:MAG: hypothetical protein HWN68_02180 [Desulfobacterales bacterium]|nr:hypothetical protein [Desulfobacterales bacterium]